jgi:hypothetical protein
VKDLTNFKIAGKNLRSRSVAQAEIDLKPWEADRTERIGLSLLKRKWQRGFGYVQDEESEEDQIRVPLPDIVHMPKIKFSLRLEKVMEAEESEGTPSTMPSVEFKQPDLCHEDSSIRKYHRRN